jgi:hypothetical protein
MLHATLFRVRGVWLERPLLEAIGAAVADEEEAAARAQAVRGIDSLGEIALQAVVAEGLRRAGFGVFREVRYPADRPRPRRSEVRRCDLVLTPAGRPLAGADAQAAPAAPAGVADPPCSLQAALWLEVKVVAQFLEGRPHRGYAAALQGPIWRDLLKLARDPAIDHAAQLIVLFTADEPTALHDLEVTLSRARRRGLSHSTPAVRGLPIVDRLGNGRCTLALTSVLR